MLQIQITNEPILSGHQLPHLYNEGYCHQLVPSRAPNQASKILMKPAGHSPVWIMGQGSEGSSRRHGLPSSVGRAVDLLPSVLLIASCLLIAQRPTQRSPRRAEQQLGKQFTLPLVCSVDEGQVGVEVGESLTLWFKQFM